MLAGEARAVVRMDGPEEIVEPAPEIAGLLAENLLDLRRPRLAARRDLRVPHAEMQQPSRNAQANFRRTGRVPSRRRFPRALRLDPDKICVAAIDMVEQAEVPSGDYQPLVDVRGLPCWPSQPDLSQLKPGSYQPGTGFECEEDPPTGRPVRLDLGRDVDQVTL